VDGEDAEGRPVPLSRVGMAVVSEPLLTARQVAELLGFAPSTIVDWYEAGKLSGFRIGGRLRFRESELVAWLET
jgi:excisionase family DNA binding protein